MARIFQFSVDFENPACRLPSRSWSPTVDETLLLAVFTKPGHVNLLPNVAKEGKEDPALREREREKVFFFSVQIILTASADF